MIHLLWGERLWPGIDHILLHALQFDNVLLSQVQCRLPLRRQFLGHPFLFVFQPFNHFTDKIIGLKSRSVGIDDITVFCQ